MCIARPGCAHPGELNADLETEKAALPCSGMTIP